MIFAPYYSFKIDTLYSGAIVFDRLNQIANIRKYGKKIYEIHCDRKSKYFKVFFNSQYGPPHIILVANLVEDEKRSNIFIKAKLNKIEYAFLFSFMLIIGFGFVVSLIKGSNDWAGYLLAMAGLWTAFTYGLWFNIRRFRKILIDELDRPTINKEAEMHELG